jgi:hypothetical protein
MGLLCGRILSKIKSSPISTTRLVDDIVREGNAAEQLIDDSVARLVFIKKPPKFKLPGLSPSYQLHDDNRRFALIGQLNAVCIDGRLDGTVEDIAAIFLAFFVDRFCRSTPYQVVDMTELLSTDFAKSQVREGAEQSLLPFLDAFGIA